MQRLDAVHDIIYFCTGWATVVLLCGIVSHDIWVLWKFNKDTYFDDYRERVLNNTDDELLIGEYTLPLHPDYGYLESLRDSGNILPQMEGHN